MSSIDDYASELFMRILELTNYSALRSIVNIYHGLPL